MKQGMSLAFGDHTKSVIFMKNYRSTARYIFLSLVLVIISIQVETVYTKTIHAFYGLVARFYQYHMNATIHPTI